MIWQATDWQITTFIVGLDKMQNAWSYQRLTDWQITTFIAGLDKMQKMHDLTSNWLTNNHLHCRARQNTKWSYNWLTNNHLHCRARQNTKWSYNWLTNNHLHCRARQNTKWSYNWLTNNHLHCRARHNTKCMIWQATVWQITTFTAGLESSAVDRVVLT